MKKIEYNKMLRTIQEEGYTENTLSISRDSFDPMGQEDGLNDKDILLLVNIIKNNHCITKLDLANNNISDTGVTALTCLQNIKELNLYGNNVKSQGAKDLANSNLKILCLADNPIFYDYQNSDNFFDVADAFAHNSTIMELNLSCSGISNETVSHIIANNKLIQILDLSDNCLDDEALRFIENNITLKYLNLSKNNIRDKGAEYISKNKSLHELYLNGSEITNSGLEYLSKHPTLLKLIAADVNNITVNGLESLLNSNLYALVLRSKKILPDELFAFYTKFNETRVQEKMINEQEDIKQVEYNLSQNKKKMITIKLNKKQEIGSQDMQNVSQFVASQSSKMEEESEEEEWQPSGVNQQNQQKLLAVYGSEFSLAILNHSEILKQFNHKHGSSNTDKLIDLCLELGNENLSELEELLYSKADLPSSQVGDITLSDPTVQINLAPLELLMGLDGGSINEQL